MIRPLHVSPCRSSAVMSVEKQPAHTSLTRIPRRAHATASVRVNETLTIAPLPDP